MGPHLPPSATVQGNAMLPPTIPVGMQVAAGMPVGIPAALSQQTTQSGAVIDHPNAGMMQLMGSAQHHQVQQPQHPPSMHPQVVHQQQQHVQQTFASMQQLPAATGQPVPAGASVAVSTMAGAAVAYEPNLTSGTASNTATTA